MIWILCLGLAIFAQAGTSWRVWLHHTEESPIFAQYGLGVTNTDLGWAVVGAAPAATRAGAGPLELVAAINGEDVLLESQEFIANRLTQADGRAVTLSLIDYAQAQEVLYESNIELDSAALNPWDALKGYVLGLRAGLGDRRLSLWIVADDYDIFRETTLAGAERNVAPTYAAMKRPFRIASQFIDVAVSLALIGVASVLRRRRFNEPVSILMSFALLLLACVGTRTLWLSLHLPLMDYLIDAAWLALFVIAIPALPSGRYVPAWTRWSMVLGPVGALALAHPDVSYEHAEAARALLLLFALSAVILRFRYTPLGPERQQMKWASLGLGAGLFLYTAGIAITVVSVLLTLPPALADWSVYLRYFLTRAAYVVMAAGLLVSLLDYRLNDADAAIGRSTGYAAVTTLIAVVWAVSTSWINQGIGLITGGGNPSLSTALSTLVALSVLTPARARIMTWTEAKFQRALVRLRSLPGRLAKWQHGDDPEPVARRALDAIVDGVNARRAALVIVTSDGPRVLATHEASPEDVMHALGGGDAQADLLFPVRRSLTEGSLVIGELLLGPRTDGSSYSRDERAALALVVDPLSDALRLTGARAEKNDALLAVIASMERRVAQVEGRRRSASPKRVATRAAPTATSG